jgi:nitrite reductase/ring-hydroxylating ferredoxin subunit
MSDFKKACAEADLADDHPKACTVDGRSVAVVKTAGRVYAVDGTCPHRGGPLSEGFVADGCIMCPWHGWGFHLDSGNYVGAPGVGIRTHATELRDGAVMVRLA